MTGWRRGPGWVAGFGSVLCAAVLGCGAQAPSSHNAASGAGSAQPVQTSAGMRGSKNAAKEEKSRSATPDQAAGVSHLQILHAPEDIVTAGDCWSRVASLTVRATQEGVRSPHIVGGGLADADSKHKLPDTAFELVQQVPGARTCEDEFAPATAQTPVPSTELTKLYIRLRKEWVRPGSYGGDLLLAAQGDTAAQTVSLKVFVRPCWSGLVGFVAILLGALLSWWATVWLARRRQLAANELLIARLDGLLERLRIRLEDMHQGGAPQAQRTPAHIAEIRRSKLQQLYDDKVLAVLAGIAVPEAGKVSVVEEVEGVTRVVQNGFVELFRLWGNYPTKQQALAPFFDQMDGLGEMVETKNTLEPRITAIINEATAAAASKGVALLTTAERFALPPFRQEAVLVQRLIRATHWLDFVSIALVVLVGMYVVIWKNPGFGNAGDFLVAFGWGLGLKFGTDTARLTPGEIRTTLGIKIPSA
jgi:hypothetical protein